MYQNVCSYLSSEISLVHLHLFVTQNYCMTSEDLRNIEHELVLQYFYGAFL